MWLICKDGPIVDCSKCCEQELSKTHLFYAASYVHCREITDKKIWPIDFDFGVVVIKTADLNGVKMISMQMGKCQIDFIGENSRMR